MNQIAHCFSFGRLEVMASGGWIGSYSALNGVFWVGYQPIFSDIRHILARVFQDNLAPACLQSTYELTARYISTYQGDLKAVSRSFDAHISNSPSKNSLSKNLHLPPPPQKSNSSLVVGTSWYWFVMMLICFFTGVSSSDESDAARASSCSW